MFSSAATILATGSTSTFVDVFLKDLMTGAVTRISTSTTGGDGNGESGSLANAAHTGAKISAEGALVVFQSEASNLNVGDTNGYSDVFLWRAATGQLTNLTQTLAAVSNPNNGNSRPDVAVNAAGQAIVVFETPRKLVAADTSNSTDVYALNVATGALTLVSATAAGAGVQGSSGDASISDDGRWVVFTSRSSALVAGDSNGVADVFVKDLATGAIALVSKSAAGAAGTLASGNASISFGGDWIVFESSAPNLASTNGNGSFTDVFRVSNPLLKDTLVGGAGNDTYVLARADVVREAAGGGTDTVVASVSYTLGANLENLTLTGTVNLSGTGNALANVITGNAGNNAINGAGGTDTASYANSTAPVTVSLAVTGAQSTGFGSDTLSNIENLIGSNRTGAGNGDRLTGNAQANRLGGGLGGDTLIGGAGDDTYVVDAATDIITEAVGAGTDTVISALTWTLGSTLENLTLSGSAAINGTGNSATNVIIGNSAANVLGGGAGNDALSGGGGNDILNGGAGNDTLTGGAGSDVIVLASLSGRDTVTDFVTGIDDLRISQAAIRIGDGDLVVDGPASRAAAGGFATSAELVIFTTNVASLGTSEAAAAIGSATSAYSVGRTALFVVDDGTSSALFLFTAADANAVVAAAELQLLATLSGTASTATGDYLFGP